MSGRRAGIATAILVGSSAVLVALIATFRRLGSTSLYAALPVIFLLAGMAAYFLATRIIFPFLSASNPKKTAVLAFSVAAGLVFGLFSAPLLPTNDVLIPRHELQIDVTGEKNAASAGDEVTLLWFTTQYGEVNYATFDQVETWQRSGGALTALAGEPASLSWRGAAGSSATLLFKTAPNAGVVTVSWSGRAEVIDLYSPQVGEYAYTRDFTLTLLDRSIFLLPLCLVLTFGFLLLMIRLASATVAAAPTAKSPRLAIAVFSVLAVALMFTRFYVNFGSAAGRQWFSNYDRFSEGLILGRMALSEREGLFSAGGLAGYVVPVDGSATAYSAQFQYGAYLEGLDFGSYVPYRSQSGGQGIIFSILDGWLPLAPGETLRLFHALAALMSALAITMIARWFAREFGLWVGGVVLASAFFSQWLALFGHNLWWSLWAFYLPMIVMFELCRLNRGKNRPISSKVLAVAILGSLVVKTTFNGFEYITTTLIMMVVPLIYHQWANAEPLRKAMKGLWVAALASLAAACLAIMLLGWQVANADKSGNTYISYLVDTLRERTSGTTQSLEADQQACLESSPFSVVSMYLDGTYLDLGHFIDLPDNTPADRLFKISYALLALVFLVSSISVWLNRERFAAPEERRKATALVASTWVSFLAPLSWLVVFKEHSCVHPHLNMIVWQMPFTLFGFATIALLLKMLLAGVKIRPTSGS